MVKWIEQLKAKIKSQDFDYKQMFLGFVILIIAIIFLAVAFHTDTDEKTETNAISKVITSKLNKETRSNRVSNIIAQNTPKSKSVAENVILNFETSTDRAMEYKVYYTTESKDSFDEDKVISYKGQTGTNKYSIPLPVKQIARFRIQLEPQAGNVTFKNINLTGTQQADLNRVEQYEFYQIENIKVNEDKSISFLSRSGAPSLVYYPSLIPEEEVTETLEEKETIEEKTVDGENNKK